MGKLKLTNKVFAIIPVFNGLKYTKECLWSFKNQTYKNFEVIIVDSGSTDGTFDYIKHHYPSFTVIKGTSHWWWTKSVAEGIKYSLKEATNNDFVLTMNNDCFFKREYLAKIVKASLNTKRSIIGSLILDAERKNKVIDAGVKISWKHSLIYGIADKISDDLKFYTDRKIITGTDTLPGKGTLIPVNVFEKIGNFNYRLLPHYIGDYEFFCRAKKHGVRLAVASDARIYNFKKRTGYYNKDGIKKSFSDKLYLLFGRKSKNNVFDHINFTLLCCPKKYLYLNLKRIAIQLILFAPLFDKIAPHIYKVKLYFHNLPIKIRQSKPVCIVLILIHNIPIMIRQFSKKHTNKQPFKIINNISKEIGLLNSKISKTS